MLVLVFTGTCVAYIFIVLWPVMRACKLSLFGLIRYLKTELIIVLATVSSETGSRTDAELENLGASKPVVGITIPAGFSFNLDGSAIYLTMATLFLAQATGIDLSWQEQLLLVGIMMLTSKGTAGSPAARSWSWPAAWPRSVPSRSPRSLSLSGWTGS